MENTFGEFGYGQGLEVIAHASQQLGLVDASGIFPTRDAMNTYIDNFVKYRLELLYVPVLGEGFNLLIGDPDIALTFTPITTMRNTLLAGVDRETAERHMVAFMHELKTTLADEVSTYKASMPRYLLDTQTQKYENGEPLMSLEAETEFLRNNPARTITYATGPVGIYFQDFVKRCYSRAQIIVDLAAQFDQHRFESLPVERFRRMAQVINNEIQGIKIKGLLADKSTLYLDGLTHALGEDEAEIYISYEDIPVFRVTDSTSTSDADAIKIENYGDKAFVVAIGMGANKVEDYIVKARQRSTGLVPGKETFTRAQLGKGITLSEMAPPTFDEQPPIDMYVSDVQTLNCENIFSGKFIQNYGRSNPDETALSVDFNSDTRVVTITANKAGTHEFELIATSPAGRAYCPIEVYVERR